MEDGRNGVRSLPYDTSYAERNGIDVLFRRCSARPYSLTYWLSVQEFVDRMIELKYQRVSFTDEVVLGVMRDIYDRRMKTRTKSDGFHYPHAKQAINQLERAIAQRQQSSPS